MAISLTHAFTSAKSDGADPTLVQPSNWNAQHVLNQSVSQKLLGRTSGGSGPTEEIGVDSSLSLTAQTLGVLGATGSFTLSGSLTPTALSADVDDYNPSNLSTTVTLRLDGGVVDRNITGLAGGADGRMMRVINIGSTNNLVLKNQSSSSQVQNRFFIGSDITITPGVTFVLQYDNTSVRWRPYSTASLSALSTSGGTLSGALNWSTAVTLASAGTVNIGAAAGNYIIITGTTTITAFDTIAQGAVRLLRFNAAVTLTHNGSSLILPGAVNYTTSAGDVLAFVSEGSGNWRCTDVLTASVPITLGNWKVGYTNGTGLWTALAVGADKTIFAFNGVSAAPTARTAANLGIMEFGVTATITKGFTNTPNQLGNMTNFTLDQTLGNYQVGINHAAFTLTAPTTDGPVDLLVINDGSAGTITFAGFSVGSVTGDTYATTDRATATVTCTSAAPGVVTWTAHGLPNNWPVYLTSTVSVPTGFTSGTVYYTKNVTTNTFELAATPGGGSITTSSTGSGTITGHACSVFMLMARRLNALATYAWKALQ